MTILLTGGGTGGHITPILAVAHELKKLQPDSKIVYVGEKNGKYASMVANNPAIDMSKQVWAGKFRRYHGESWLTRLFDIRTLLLNIRDFFLFCAGTLEALVLVRRLKPQVVFLKGGFVGVPIGLACAVWRVPFITHDSDALPGLANRIVGKWAALHATAMSVDYYNYPLAKTHQVGVLVGPQYSKVNPEMKQEFRVRIGIPETAKLLMITGGSGGSQSINQAIAKGLQEALNHNSDLYVVHQTGIGKSDIYNGYTHERLQIHELLKDMHIYSGAADLIVTRAGANTVAEFGIQQKPIIVVPNPLLTGGHQLLNARYLEENKAAYIVQENLLSKGQGTELWTQITRLLYDKKASDNLAKNLNQITIKDAASKLALLILKATK